MQMAHFIIIYVILLGYDYEILSSLVFTYNNISYFFYLL